MKRLIAPFFLIILVGCQGYEKKLISFKHIKDIDINEIEEQTSNLPIDIEPKYALSAYKIVYKTKDISNKEINASGLIVVPKDINSSLNIVLDFHPTIFKNSKAPTNIVKNSISTEAIFSSQAKIATLKPDFIGFGESKNIYHPYLIKKVASNMAADFLKASFEFAQKKGIKFDIFSNLYITGYSEGGYIALSALKKFQQIGIDVKLTIPMDGPYILYPFAEYAFKLNSIAKPSIVAFTAYSYAKAYNKNLDEISYINYENIFNKELDKDEIDNILPKKLNGEDGLFKESFVKNGLHSWFGARLKINRVVDFKATTPVRLLHCIGDDAIDINLSYISAKIFTQYYGSTDVKVIPVERFITQNRYTNLRLKHKECAIYAYKSAYILINSYK